MTLTFEDDEMKETMYGQELEGFKHITRAEIEASLARAALKAENRRLKTLVQEGRATGAQEARLTQVRNELMETAR